MATRGEGWTRLIHDMLVTEQEHEESIGLVQVSV